MRGSLLQRHTLQLPGSTLGASSQLVRIWLLSI